nr:hypothetical protein B0A51_08341 [Rachicladosporium sp. CCFEE 5018]
MVSSIAVLSGFFAVTLALNKSALPLPVTEIFQFPRGSYIEALQFRPNGKLLGNLLAPEASIYQFDVVEKSARKVVSIPSVNGLYGLTDGLPDQYYAAGGNFSLRASTRAAGSFGIFHVNLTSFDNTGLATVEEVSHFANATPNGLWTLNAKTGIILAADATNGVVYRVNVNTGVNEITVSDPLMKPPANASTYPSPNGIAVRDGYLYFTNTGAGTFGRVPITAAGVQTGPAQLVAVTAGGNPGGDDWTFDAAGNVFLGENPNNWVSVLPKGSKTPVIIAGGPNSTAVLGPNTVRFGVSTLDRSRKSLYIGTSGGLPQYRSGNFTNGGGVYRIDTAALNL